MKVRLNRYGAIDDKMGRDVFATMCGRWAWLRWVERCRLASLRADVTSYRLPKGD